MAAGVGTRVVLRYRIDPEPLHGPRLSDAVGVITELTPTRVWLATKSGNVVVDRALIVAAREVPIPPPSRPRSAAAE